MPSKGTPYGDSLKNDITRLHKSAASKLFTDDYNSKNQFNFEGNYNADRSKAQIKSNVKVLNKDSTVSFAHDNESRFDFNLKGNNKLRIKMKPKDVQTHLSFNPFFVKPQMGGHIFDVLVNPYVIWDTSRQFQNNKLSFGAIHNSHGGDFIRDNRVQLRREDGKVKAKYVSNMKLNVKGFVINALYALECGNPKFTTQRDISAEYKRNNLSLSTELKQAKTAHFSDWAFNQVGFGLSYKLCKNTTVGLWSQTDFEQNFTKGTIGVERQLKDTVSVKAKVDTNLDMEMVSKMKVSDNSDIHFSLLTSLDKERNINLYNYGAMFGLKLKFNN